MKYRIKRIDSKYYPQKKRFLFWRYIKIPTCRLYDSHVLDTTDNTKIKLSASSFINAKRDLANYIDNYLHPFFCKNTIVKTYYDPNRGKYLYVDIKSDERFSDNAEEICEIISEYKRVTIYEYTED